MDVSYNKLWKLLIDRGIKKGQLREAVNASKSTFAKLSKNEAVALPILLRICSYLQCDFGDIMEAVSEQQEGEMK
jgi:DNA-binding Xre family transcriptional regulator